MRLRTRVSRHLRRGEKMRHFTIIGAGLGTPEGLTGEAKAALLSAGCVFGTRRLAVQLSGLRKIETCAFTDLAERAKEADAEQSGIGCLCSGKRIDRLLRKIRAKQCAALIDPQRDSIFFRALPQAFRHKGSIFGCLRIIFRVLPQDTQL